MKKWKGGIFVAVAAIAAAIGLYTGIKKSELQSAQLAAVDAFYAASMIDSSGHPQSLSQWRGKTLLVNFWATWCSPCVQEMPELSALQDTATKKNIQIIGIGIDSANNIKEFSSKYKISYPLYIAGTNGVDLLKKFGNQAGGLPFTILIDQDGQIKKSYLGRLKMEALKHDLKLP